MKKLGLFITIGFIFLATLCVEGQTKAKQMADGNYTAVVNVKESKAVKTDKYFIDSKGIKYPLWKSGTGRLFYKKTPKSGKTYPVYLDVKITK